MESRASFASRFRGRALQWAALDLRALAVLRIGIASTFFLTLVQRGSELRFFFTDEGMAPRAWLFAEFFPSSGFSIYTMSGQFGVVAAFYLIHMALALAVACGWKTRWATPALWFFTTSLCNRNSTLLDGGDELTRIVLFWGIFLPWGRVWSWDAYRAEEPRVQGRALASPWTAAFLVQAATLYGFAGWSKSGIEWVDGTAAHLFLGQASMIRPWSQVLLSYPDFLEASVLAVVWLERVAPVLILFPFFGLWLRVIAVVGLSVFQIAMFAIADFPLLSVAFLVFTLCLVPPRCMPGEKAQEVRWEGSQVGGFVASMLIGLVLAWNTFVFHYIVEYPNRFLLPQPVKYLTISLGMNQFWAFFAPYPPRVYGWMVVEAVLEDGQVVDLVTGGDPVWDEPEDLTKRVPNHSWRMVTRASITIASVREHLLLGLIKRFERKNPGKRVARADLYHVQFRFEVDGQKTGPHARLIESWPASFEEASEHNHPE